MWDDDSGYELSDPKHPTYHERHAEAADRRRKSEREEALVVGRELASKIDAVVSADGGNARYSRFQVVVSYGPGLGEFQTLSLPQAKEYVARLDAGDRGAPWKMGIG